MGGIKLLVLDGGGIRGIISLYYLLYLEQDLIKLTGKTIYETFDVLYVNKGVFLPMLSPHHLRNKLFFPDGTKKYELNNILYRFFYTIKNIIF